ncbi:hypothetical protein LA080_004539 [Diaporthe eres]|nr:hypothetical protein LA080_004539 [Diaporthe eres]
MNSLPTPPSLGLSTSQTWPADRARSSVTCTQFDEMTARETSPPPSPIASVPRPQHQQRVASVFDSATPPP